jgi:cyclopropane fatty-acyl-phospholipid synthase-like methyltransferase
MPIYLSVSERALSHLNKLPIPILDAFANVLLGRALMVCNSSGLFDVLHGSPCSAAELAVKTGISEQGAEVLLQIVEVGGYVVRKGDRFRNTKVAERWLTKTSPNFLGNLVLYFETLFPRWADLGHTVGQGEPEKSYFEHFNDRDWEIYTYAMMDLARLLMPEILKVVQVPGSAQRLLDLGGSHGLYSIELCRCHPGLTADVLDLEKVVEVGRKITEDLGMSSRVIHHAADFKKDDLGSEYDVVLAFNIIHGLKPAENVSLMKKISSALNRQGMIFILDQLKDGKERNSLSRLIPAAVGLNLFNEIGGSAYSSREVRDWSYEAGFVDCGVKRLRAPGVSIIQARKP